MEQFIPPAYSSRILDKPLYNLFVKYLRHTSTQSVDLESGDSDRLSEASTNTAKSMKTKNVCVPTTQELRDVGFIPTTNSTDSTLQAQDQVCYLRRKFRRWAKSMSLQNDKLLYNHSCEILPVEEWAETILQTHCNEGLFNKKMPAELQGLHHRSLQTTINAFQERYCFGHSYFGPNEADVVSILGSCNAKLCRYHLEEAKKQRTTPTLTAAPCMLQPPDPSIPLLNSNLPGPQGDGNAIQRPRNTGMFPEKSQSSTQMSLSLTATVTSTVTTQVKTPKQQLQPTLSRNLVQRGYSSSEESLVEISSDSFSISPTLPALDDTEFAFAAPQSTTIQTQQKRPYRKILPARTTGIPLSTITYPIKISSTSESAKESSDDSGNYIRGYLVCDPNVLQIIPRLPPGNVSGNTPQPLADHQSEMQQNYEVGPYQVSARVQNNNPQIVSSTVSMTQQFSRNGPPGVASQVSTDGASCRIPAADAQKTHGQCSPRKKRKMKHLSGVSRESQISQDLQMQEKSRKYPTMTGLLHKPPVKDASESGKEEKLQRIINSAFTQLASSKGVKSAETMPPSLLTAKTGNEKRHPEKRKKKKKRKISEPGTKYCKYAVNDKSLKEDSLHWKDHHPAVGNTQTVRAPIWNPPVTFADHQGLRYEDMPPQVQQMTDTAAKYTQPNESIITGQHHYPTYTVSQPGVSSLPQNTAAVTSEQVARTSVASNLQSKPMQATASSPASDQALPLPNTLTEPKKRVTDTKRFGVIPVKVSAHLEAATNDTENADIRDDLVGLQKTMKVQYKKWNDVMEKLFKSGLMPTKHTEGEKNAHQNILHKHEDLADQGNSDESKGCDKSSSTKRTTSHDGSGHYSGVSQALADPDIRSHIYDIHRHYLAQQRLWDVVMKHLPDVKPQPSENQKSNVPPEVEKSDSLNLNREASVPKLVIKRRKDSLDHTRMHVSQSNEDVRKQQAEPEVMSQQNSSLSVQVTVTVEEKKAQEVDTIDTKMDQDSQTQKVPLQPCVAGNTARSVHGNNEEQLTKKHRKKKKKKDKHKQMTEAIVSEDFVHFQPPRTLAANPQILSNNCNPLDNLPVPYLAGDMAVNTISEPVTQKSFHFKKKPKTPKEDSSSAKKRFRFKRKAPESEDIGVERKTSKRHEAMPSTMTTVSSTDHCEMRREKVEKGDTDTEERKAKSPSVVKIDSLDALSSYVGQFPHFTNLAQIIKDLKLGSADTLKQKAAQVPKAYDMKRNGDENNNEVEVKEDVKEEACEMKYESLAPHPEQNVKQEMCSEAPTDRSPQSDEQKTEKSACPEDQMVKEEVNTLRASTDDRDVEDPVEHHQEQQLLDNDENVTEKVRVKREEDITRTETAADPEAGRRLESQYTDIMDAIQALQLDLKHLRGPKANAASKKLWERICHTESMIQLCRTTLTSMSPEN